MDLSYMGIKLPLRKSHVMAFLTFPSATRIRGMKLFHVTLQIGSLCECLVDHEKRKFRTHNISFSLKNIEIKVKFKSKCYKKNVDIKLGSITD